MDFGHALAALKAGSKVARTGCWSIGFKLTERY
jgi:hypothetical protein